LIAIRLLPDRPVGEETPAEETNHGTLAAGWKPLAGLLAVILLVRALQSGGIGVVMTFTNVYLDEALMVPTSRIGLITGFGRLLGVPMSLTVPWLVSRFGNFKLVHLSLGLIALLIVPLALVPYWPVAALAVIGISSMGSVRYLSFIGFTMALVSDKQRSLISGTNEMAIGAGFAISSFIGGYLIAWLGYRELFLFGSALTVLGTVVFGLIFWRRSGQTARPAPIPRAPKL
ncbi:MAG: MFS transporter, partial [Anaerolineales bacterium]|nr:MFS transporter [Anaerolineales bacterium]